MCPIMEQPSRGGLNSQLEISLASACLLQSIFICTEEQDFPISILRPISARLAVPEVKIEYCCCSFICSFLHACTGARRCRWSKLKLTIVDFLVRGLLKNWLHVQRTNVILMLVSLGSGDQAPPGAYALSIKMCSRSHLKTRKDASGSSDVILLIL